MAIDNYLYVCGRKFLGRNRAVVWTWDGSSLTEIFDRYVTPQNAQAHACSTFSDGNLYVVGQGSTSHDTEGFILQYDGSTWTEEWTGSAADTSVDDVVEFKGDLYITRQDGASTCKVYKRNGGTWSLVHTCASNNSATFSGNLATDTDGTEYIICAPYNVFTGGERFYYSTDGTTWNGLGDLGLAGWLQPSYIFYDVFNGLWRAWFKGAANERTKATLTAGGWADGGNPGHLANDVAFCNMYKTSASIVYVGIRQEDCYRRFDAGVWNDDYSYLPATLQVDNYRRSDFTSWNGVPFGVVTDTTPSSKLMRLASGSWTQQAITGTAFFAGVAGFASPPTCVYDGAISGSYTVTITL